MFHKIQKKYLVIACGSNCPGGNHQSSEWSSVDPDLERKAEIQTDLEAAMSSGLNNKQYEIVFIESITDGIDKNRIKFIDQLTAKDGAIIIAPCKNKEYILDNVKIDGYISAPGVLILFKNYNEKIRDGIISVIKKDIPNIFDSIKKYYIFQKKIENELYKYLHDKPLLISILSHLQVYIENRNSRSMRNFFRDKKYNVFLEHMKKGIIFLACSRLEPDHIIMMIDSWKKELPSTTKPMHKLNYEPLQSILELTKFAIFNYKNRLITEEKYSVSNKY